MPITAKAAIEKNFMRAKWEAEQKRQEEVGNRLDLFKDDYEEIIREKMKENFHPDNYKRLYYHVNGSQNLLKRVINEISMVYKEEAQRELEPKSDRYLEIIDSMNIDSFMKRVNRYTNLLNEMIVKVGIRRGQISFDLITPNICGVIQNDADPTDIDAIYYQVTRVNTLGDSEINYHYWSKDGDYLVFDKSFRMVRMVYSDIEWEQAEYGVFPYRDENNLPVLPFVILHREEPDSTFWDQDSGRDLYNAAVSIGVKMTLFDYYFKTSSFKQIYVSGEEINVPDKQILDPLTALQISGKGATAGVLDMQNNLEPLQNALIFQLNSVINNYGISADQWTLSISEMSGVALRIRNRALLEKRQEQLPTYRKGEQDLFRITKIVNNAHFKNKINDKAKFTIDFGEIEFPEDPKERLNFAIEKLKAGLMSLGQFYMMFNPDFKDEKKAEAEIIKNLELMAALRGKHSSLDEMLKAIFKELPEGEGEGEESASEGEEE